MHVLFNYLSMIFIIMRLIYDLVYIIYAINPDIVSLFVVYIYILLIGINKIIFLFKKIKF